MNALGAALGLLRECEYVLAASSRSDDSDVLRAPKRPRIEPVQPLLPFPFVTDGSVKSGLSPSSTLTLILCPVDVRPVARRKRLPTALDTDVRERVVGAKEGAVVWDEKPDVDGGRAEVFHE